MKKETIPLAQLSPSAARLLLAMESRFDHEQLDQIIIRSGIRNWKTYWKAKQQLLDGGYLYHKGDALLSTVKPR